MVISFSNQKGGVGKTTTTLAVASILASHGKKVLVIDLDPQCNLTKIVCGSQEFTADETVYNTMINRGELPIYSSDSISGLDLVPSYCDMSDAGGLPVALRDQLMKVRKEYDFVFIDCPPALGYLTRSSYVSSDMILVIVNPGGWELDGVNAVNGAIDDLKTFNDDIKVKIIKNRFNYKSNDKRTKVAVRLTDNALEQNPYYKSILCETFIPDSTKVTEAQIYGKDIFSYDKGDHAAKAFVRLTNEVFE